MGFNDGHRPSPAPRKGNRVTDSQMLKLGQNPGRARTIQEAEQTIENDPLVRALMSQYKTARIVPGSVKSL